ncbi:MAG: tRNA1(Val) (adenine(37)-N6)-methyltransferase [Lachnospiraceae bacterium]|nr:tRNA1(Val) (adenine(37)-N6)-methyltransferase [Lachnospiraceae bacterium]
MDEESRIQLKENERIDDLQRNGYKIIQNEKKFCFGMDAVLLSGFAVVRQKETVLDIGTGTGIIPILLEAKTESSHLTGLEIQEESAEMARRSVILNGLEKKIDIITGDINNTRDFFEQGSFDVITTNPPYMIGKHGLIGDNKEKAIARHEITATLDDFVREGSRLLRDKGRFYMVHRPFRMVEIFATLTKYRLEPKRIKMVHPFIDKEPNMILIESIKGGNSRLTVEKPLIVYREPGVYMDEIYDIYGY